MEFRNTTIIGVSLPDRSVQKGGYHLHAEIIIIERLHDRLHPLIYQLRKESTPFVLSEQIEGLIHLPEGAFMMMGEVSAIDKQHKTIHLTNGNTVSYKYLVISSEMHRPTFGGANQRTCSQALDTLIEALNIHKNLPQKVQFTDFYHNRLKNDVQHKILTDQDKVIWDEIRNLVTQKVEVQQLDTNAFYGETKRLSELQL